jgi:hypothetical protein
MVSIKDRNAKFYSEEGIKALENRIKSLIDIFNKNQFPFGPHMVLGFGNLFIEDREECFGRIKELMDLIGFQLQLNRITNEKGEVLGYEIKY